MLPSFHSDHTDVGQLEIRLCKDNIGHEGDIGLRQTGRRCGNREGNAVVGDEATQSA